MRIDLGRGVFLSAAGCKHQIGIGRASPSIPRPDEADVTLNLTVPAGGAAPMDLELGLQARLQLKAPSVSIDSLLGAQGTVRITDWSTTRGGALKGSLEARTTQAGQAVRVSGTFSTYVRDLDPLEADRFREYEVRQK